MKKFLAKAVATVAALSMTLALGVTANAETILSQDAFDKVTGEQIETKVFNAVKDKSDDFAQHVSHKKTTDVDGRVFVDGVNTGATDDMALYATIAKFYNKENPNGLQNILGVIDISRDHTGDADMAKAQLGKGVTVKINVPDALNGKTVSVFHYAVAPTANYAVSKVTGLAYVKVSGTGYTPEKLGAVKVEDGVLTFTTKSMSPFAFILGDVTLDGQTAAAAATTPAAAAKAPKTGATIPAASYVLVAGIAGAVACLKKLA